MSQLQLRSGPLAGSYDCVLLLTDLEPDDAVAIKALAPMLRVVPLLVVVGEGDRDKTELALDVLAAYNLLSYATIVQGQLSKLPYPEDMLGAYRGMAQVMGGASDHIERAQSASDLACRFLAKHGAPLVLGLKPPHELLDLSEDLLGRASAAFYGSFNFVVMRETLMAAGMTREQAEGGQEALLQAFRACIFVERSNSVGRDHVLDRYMKGTVWSSVAADAGLMRLCRGWNFTITRSHAKQLVKNATEVSDMCNPNTAVGEEDHVMNFEAMAQAVAKMDKTMAIMKSIVETGGEQICNADPLVAALLLDSEGVLQPFFQPKVSHSAAVREGSNVMTLVAETSAQRAELQALVVGLLSGALSVPSQ